MIWLRSRGDELDDVIDELEAQHVEGAARVREMEQALTRYELSGASAAPALRTLVDGYAVFYAHHRRLEEEIILPGAVRFFSALDWMELDEAFEANRDPFNGSELECGLDRLYGLIANTVGTTIE